MQSHTALSANGIKNKMEQEIEPEESDLLVLQVINHRVLDNKKGIKSR
jgi:hypothetical protein